MSDMILTNLKFSCFISGVLVTLGVFALFNFIAIVNK